MFNTARWSAMKNASNRACSNVWMNARMLQVEVGVGVRSRIAPPGRMDGDRSHDGAKMKLLCHVERSLREFRHITRFTHVAPDRFGIFGPCGRRDPRNRPLLTLNRSGFAGG